MKLFKSLLIAPAAFGLMAPIAVNADTAFSPTSKLGSSVNFTIGSNTDSADGDELHSTYEMKFKSTTSFTGEDKLVGKFEIGNGKTLGGGIDPQSSKGGGTTPTLTDLYYQLPLSDGLTVSFGPKMDGDQAFCLCRTEKKFLSELHHQSYKLRLHNLLQQELHGVFHECFYRLQQFKFLTWMDS